MREPEGPRSGGEEEELTGEERRALAALPRERDPGSPLEERVVAALRGEGLLRPAAAGESSRGVGRGRPERWRWAGPAPRADRRRWGLAAAAAAVFVVGFAAGQVWGARTTADALTAARAADAEVNAALVQQTGSAYVAALAALAARTDADSGGDGRQGAEVALVALRAAADELARLDPDNAAVTQVLRILEAPRVAAGDSAGTAQQVLWF